MMADKHDEKSENADIDTLSGQNVNEEWVTVAEAARRLGKSKRTIRRYIGKGVLACRREGRRVFVHMSGQMSAQNDRDILIAELSTKVDVLTGEVQNLRQALSNDEQSAMITDVATQQQPIVAKADSSHSNQKHRPPLLSVAVMVSPILLIILLGLLVVWVLCSIFWGYVLLSGIG